MQAYTIKRIGPAEYYQWKQDDDDHVNALWVQAIRREMEQGHRLVFVCTNNGDYLGRVELVLEHSDPDYTIPHKRIHISMLSVRTEAFGRGVGSALIDYLIDYCRAVGYEEISLGVNLNNPEARNLYKKKGFTEVIGEWEDADGKYLKLLKKLGSFQD